MRILQVNSADIAGGAEGSSWRLFNALQERNHDSWLAVGKKRGTHEMILQIPNDEHRSRWAKFIYKNSSLLHEKKLAPHILSLLRIVAEPWRWIERHMGVEDFNYPGSRRILELLPNPPDVVHLFNLHGDYFDLRMLPQLSRQVPTILNPRDAWLLSGHCAHSFECARWKTGCGHCPDLTIYPLVKRDATAYNWKRKKQIFSQSRLYVVTPSHWLMEKIEQSILANSVVKSCVIPTGVDMSLFSPVNLQEVRRKIGLPMDTKILLFTANSIQKNIWKDYKMLEAAIATATERLNGQKILFIALGETGDGMQIGQSEIKFIPFQQDRNIVADYYRAADVYLHAARADTFPNTVLESLACGTPVIATKVGGIPEQVKGLGDSAPNNYDVEDATGILVSMGNVQEMADAIINLLTNDPLRSRLGQNAAQDSRQRFDFNLQVDRFIDWYQEVIEDWVITFGRR